MLLKKKWLKFSDYFKKNGIKTTIKRTIFHLRFKAKSEIIPNKNNLYKVKEKNKKNIGLKSDKQAFVITENPFHYNDGKHQGAHYSKVLNEMGYLVFYYYSKPNIKNQHGLMPPTITHEYINQKTNIELHKNDILILKQA